MIQTDAVGTPEPIKRPSGPSGVSVLLTVLSTLVVAGTVGLFVWNVADMSPLERLQEPERALERVVSRSMEMEEALRAVSPWERSFYRLIWGEDSALEQAIRDYGELVEFSTDPFSRFYLAVLEAEAGNPKSVHKWIAHWREAGSPYSWLSRFLWAAYVTPPADSVQAIRVQAHLAEMLPANWFYSRLAFRIADWTGDTELKTLIHHEQRKRGNRLLFVYRALVLMELAICLGGLWLIIRSKVQSWGPRPPSQPHPWPPPWTTYEGYAAFVKGWALAIGVMVGVVVGGVDNRIVESAGWILLYSPVLLLAYFQLLAPNHLSVERVFGLGMIRSRPGTVFETVVLVTAAGLAGDWLVVWMAQAMGYTFHWTEWFDPHLVWGETTDLLRLEVEYVLVAPALEEMIFRGILFGTIRQTTRWSLAALLSASVFAMVHGYGPVGFFTVLWSGFLWAWTYEKSRSLWPGMLAHGLNNLFVTVTVVGLFR